MAAGVAGALCAIRPRLLCLCAAAAVSSRTVQASGRHMASPVLSVSKLGFPWQTDDPFLFCVYHNDTFPPGDADMGPAVADLWRGRNRGSDFGSKDWNMYHGKKLPGFPRHPHRGFETVTVVRHGVVDHADGLGCSGRFGDGDVQWMTAGRGITHSEMFPLRSQHTQNRLELFQIWVNLPSRSKMAEPHFSMLWAETLPFSSHADAAGRMTKVCTIAGRIEGGEAPPQPPPASWASAQENDVGQCRPARPSCAAPCLPAWLASQTSPSTLSACRP